MNYEQIKELLQAIKDEKEGFMLGYHVQKQIQLLANQDSQSFWASELLKLLEMCEGHEPIEYKEQP